MIENNNEDTRYSDGQVELKKKIKYRNCKKDYDILANGERKDFLDRARKNSYYTDKSIMPEEGSTSSTKYQKIFTNIGLIYQRKYIAKYSNWMIPTNRTFFKSDLTKKEEKNIFKENPAQLPIIQDSLFTRDKSVQQYINSSMVRDDFNFLLENDTVVGTCIFNQNKEGQWRVIQLDSFVLESDTFNNILTMIIKEVIDYDLLPKEIQSQINLNDTADIDTDIGLSGHSGLDRKEFELYTRIYKDGKNWVLYQECQDIVFGIKKYKKDTLPFIPSFGKNSKKNETYGRAITDGIADTLETIQVMEKISQQSAITMSDIKYLVKRGVSIDLTELTESPSGTFVYADPDSIKALQTNKTYDVQPLMNKIIELKQEVKEFFMAVITRDAERVVTREIAVQEKEVDLELVADFSRKSESVLLPFIKLNILYMEKNDLITEIPREDIEITIITGIDSYGKNQNLQNLMSYSEIVSNNEQLAARMDWGEFNRRLGNLLDIEMDGLVKSDETMAKEQQAAQSARIAEQVAPEVTKQTTQGLIDGKVSQEDLQNLQQ